MVDYQKLLKKTYKETKKIKGGRKAHYIPELAKVDSKLFGISICDVKGKLFSIGDHNKPVAIDGSAGILSNGAEIDITFFFLIYQNSDLHYLTYQFCLIILLIYFVVLEPKPFLQGL